MKIWKPLYCNCSIQMTDDWKTGKNILKACSAHENITDAVDLYDTCLAESRRAMDILRSVENQMPEVFDVVLDGDGKIVSKDFKPGREIRFSYGKRPDDRTLNVELVGFGWAARARAIDIISESVVPNNNNLISVK